jgi:hypothetical protein
MLEHLQKQLTKDEAESQKNIEKETEPLTHDDESKGDDLKEQREPFGGTPALPLNDQKLQKAYILWMKAVRMETLGSTEVEHIEFLHYHYKHFIDAKLLDMMSDDAGSCYKCVPRNGFTCCDPICYRLNHRRGWPPSLALCATVTISTISFVLLSLNVYYNSRPK